MSLLDGREILTLLGSAVALAAVSPMARARSPIVPGETDVLAVIDVQHCFVPGGTLPVPQGDQVVPPINRLAQAFHHVILTQDWHTPAHVSFASSHPGRRPFETVGLPYGPQVLWPDHAVQGTTDAELHRALRIPHAELVIRKGYRQQVDSYSAFLEADRTTPTGLGGYLRERGFRRVFLVGLATDFCVAWSALDARRAGFEALVIEDGTRAIDTGGSLAKAWVKYVTSGAGQKTLKSFGFLPPPPPTTTGPGRR